MNEETKATLDRVIEELETAMKLLTPGPNYINDKTVRLWTNAWQTGQGKLFGVLKFLKAAKDIEQEKE